MTSSVVSDVVIRKKMIESIRVGNSDLSFGEYVLAAGSWSGVLGKKLGLKLPMQAGKGYSFTLNDVTKNIKIPTILLEGRVAVTPNGQLMRLVVRWR